MTYDYSLMNGLGGLGLTTGSMYSSYDPSMMMGMYGMNGLTGMGAYGGYGMGMMGMYNPAFMAQMNQYQQQMEKSQVQHSADMHDILTQTRVQNLSAEDRAFFESVAQDGGIRANIENLADVIRKGDQDQICAKYDEVKQTILTKYNSYFQNNLANMDAEATIRGVIENMYQTMISKQAGETVDLKSDIKRYGETAMGYGFNKGFASGGWLGKLFGTNNEDDYHKRYTEETLNYIYHTGIDSKHNKDKMKTFGNFWGKTARTLAAPGAGAVVGGIIGKFCGHGTIGAWIGAALALAGDFWWQSTSVES